jgi:hypothetical protein
MGLGNLRRIVMCLKREVFVLVFKLLPPKVWHVGFSWCPDPLFHNSYRYRDKISITTLGTVTAACKKGFFFLFFEHGL